MSNVCQNQDTFNQSVNQAIKYVDKKNMPSKTVQIIALVIFFVILLWALMLASKSGMDKTLHYVLAMVFSPVYILSYYLARMNA
jgi:uncharacterized membrane protein YvbJ